MKILQGHRSFNCHECGHEWELPSRDHTSPSGEDCPKCQAWTYPHGSRAASDIPDRKKAGNAIGSPIFAAVIAKARGHEGPPDKPTLFSHSQHVSENDRAELDKFALYLRAIARWDNEHDELPDWAPVSPQQEMTYAKKRLKAHAAIYEQIYGEKL